MLQDRFADRAQAMTSIALWSPQRLADLVRRLVCAGFMAVLVFTLAADIREECGGAFNLGFSTGFDRRHCDFVIRGSETIRMRLPFPF